MEKGAVREGERKERKREREKSAAKREERRTEASGRLNNIIGGVLTVPGRPRANSSPLSPYGPSPSPYSLLPLSLAASYSPARKLRPRWALTEGPTESFEFRRWDGETLIERCRTQTRTHERVRGYLALADRHRGRGSFSPSLRSSPFSFFLLGVSTSKRASALLSLPLPPRVRLLLPFRNFDALESDFPPVPFPPPFPSLLFLLCPLCLHVLLFSLRWSPPPRKLTGFTQLIK